MILRLEDLQDEQAYRGIHKEEVVVQKNQWAKGRLCRRTAGSSVEEVLP